MDVRDSWIIHLDRSGFNRGYRENWSYKWSLDFQGWSHRVLDWRAVTRQIWFQLKRKIPQMVIEFYEKCISKDFFQGLDAVRFIGDSNYHIICRPHDNLQEDKDTLVSKIDWFNLIVSTAKVNKLYEQCTFFRVKLVFEFEFEISWSSGPLDLLTQRPWDSWTLLGPLPSSTTSTYPFLLH